MEYIMEYLLEYLIDIVGDGNVKIFFLFLLI